MQYCPVTEAFDNSLKKQLNEYESNNNNNNKSHNNQGITPQYTFDNYNDIDIQHQYINNSNDYKQAYPAFFTAQGEYENKDKQCENKDKYFGTSINDLKDNESLDANISFCDSDLSHDSSLSSKPKPKLTHDFCINKMINSLTEDQDTLSIASSKNEELNKEIYNHVKSCKHCKNKINEKMREQYKSKLNTENIINDIDKKEDIKEYFTTQTLGYDLKELMIIILAGIVLIFILDLLVKIGKKMTK